MEDVRGLLGFCPVTTSRGLAPIGMAPNEQVLLKAGIVALSFNAITNVQLLSSVE